MEFLRSTFLEKANCISDLNRLTDEWMKLANRSQQLVRLLMISSFFGASVLASAAVSASTQAVSLDETQITPMSLKEAVDIAIKNNPLVRETDATVQAATAQIPVTRSLIFPNVSLLASAADKTDPLNSNPKFDGTDYNTYTTDLHLSQPLLVFGSFAAVNSSKKDLGLRKLDREITQRNLTAQVVQAYFAVVLDMRNLDTLVRNQKIQQEALGVAQKRERTGRGQTLDVLQVKTQLALLKSQIANAQNQIEIASATLANFLGDPKARVLRVKDRLDAPDLSAVDKAVDLGRFRLPELEQNRLSIEQIDDLKQVALGGNLPTIFATADYTFSAFKRSDLFDRSAAGTSVMLNLSVPIFSGFSSIYQRQVLNANRLRLEYDRQNIVDNTNLNQVSSRKQLETAEQSIVEGREALRLALASSDEARRMFRFATIDFLQLLTIQQAFVQAESLFNQYKYNYVVALSQYYVNSGQELGGLIDTLEKANQ